MHFSTKNYLKNNRYYTIKHSFNYMYSMEKKKKEAIS